MRFFVMWLMLVLSSIAIAGTTINGTIEKGKYFDTTYREEIEETKKFTSKNYRVYIKKFVLANSSDKHFNPNLYKAIFFNLKLDLIKYDKFNDHYMFKLTLGPGVACGNEGKGPYKTINKAKIYFAENNQESMVIQGKFNRILYADRKDSIYEYPPLKIDKSSISPFRLTILKPNARSPSINLEYLKRLIVSIQHDVPIIITFV